MSLQESCILYTRTKLTNRGYGRYRYKGKMVLAHRVEYCKANKISLESIRELVVRHKCDNPQCINPEHLELGTQADNIRDMNERGRQANVHGVDSPHAVLNEDQVKYIKQHTTKGCRVNGYSAIARRLGVSDVMVRFIALGKQWKHIEVTA